MRFIRRIMTGVAVLGAATIAMTSLSGQEKSNIEDVSDQAVSSSPAAPATLNSADAEVWIDGFLPYAIERGQIAGAVVVVVKNGKPILEKGYGFADVASRRPVDPDRTMFRPGSTSKLFTWTAVMQQVEAGKLDLDVDVNTYLDFSIPPYQGKAITLRNILTHTAGFEESIRYLISNDPKAVLSLADYSERALPQRVFAPGTTPAYSNYATALAGHIVERVSGIPFDDYVEQRIFEPLGMRHSTFRQPLPEKFKPFMSSGYPTIGEKAQPFEIVIPAPAGSLSASGADMARFMIAHLADGEGLMTPATASLMHNYHAPNIGPLNTMALGFYEQWINGHRSIGHGGDTGLFHSYMWLFPDQDIGLYISLNSSGKEGAAQAVRSAFFQKFADRYLPAGKKYAPVDSKTAKAHAALMAGHYVMSRGSFTNFMSLFGLLSPTEVAVGPDGKIMVPALDGLSAGVRDWVEVEPFVWRDSTTGERLAAEVKNGQVVRFSIDTFSPFTVLEPAPAGVNAGWLIPALIVALGLTALAAFAWPIRALVRRRFNAEFMLRDRPLLAYRLTRGFAWLVLLAVAGWTGFIVTFSSDLGSVGGPLDWLIYLLRLITPLAAFGLFATSVWHLWLCFRDKSGWTMKAGAFLLVFSGLVLTWVTLQFHLYGIGMVY
ncbi:serine hydrolase domain-containing protein [Parasphingorhabdus sp.]|uniref:serine hydrolase domain-containing protein n=1 Tax=Parasphingorhabdus sp. TaxID=2709688 RepID=UPI003A913507